MLAFSCKKRGFCPSCGARRMAESARHLTELSSPTENPCARIVLEALLGVVLISRRGSQQHDHALWLESPSGLLDKALADASLLIQSINSKVREVSDVGEIREGA